MDQLLYHRTFTIVPRKKLGFTYELLSTSTMAQIERENQKLKQREKNKQSKFDTCYGFLLFFRPL